jgi:hypothetical protein
MANGNADYNEMHRAVDRAIRMQDLSITTCTLMNKVIDQLLSATAATQAAQADHIASLKVHLGDLTQLNEDKDSDIWDLEKEVEKLKEAAKGAVENDDDGDFDAALDKIADTNSDDDGPA